MAKKLKTEYYKGCYIHFNESQNINKTRFVYASVIWLDGHNILKDTSINVDGWTKIEAFQNAKKYIDKWLNQGDKKWQH